MSYYVYILKCSDSTFYTGITTDIVRRLDEHNHSDRGAKYTRVRRPVELIYSEEAEDRRGAAQREYAIKKLTKLKKIELIASLQDTYTKHS